MFKLNKNIVLDRQQKLQFSNNRGRIYIGYFKFLSFIFFLLFISLLHWFLSLFFFLRYEKKNILTFLSYFSFPFLWLFPFLLPRWTFLFIGIIWLSLAFILKKNIVFIFLFIKLTLLITSLVSLFIIYQIKKLLCFSFRNVLQILHFTFPFKFSVKIWRFIFIKFNLLHITNVLWF